MIKFQNNPAEWELRPVETVTRRERIATAALVGVLSYPSSAGTPQSFAEYAVSCADALIAELDKEPCR